MREAMSPSASAALTSHHRGYHRQIVLRSVRQLHEKNRLRFLGGNHLLHRITKCLGDDADHDARRNEEPQS
jgi:hypothetical protein